LPAPRSGLRRPSESPVLHRWQRPRRQWSVRFAATPRASLADYLTRPSSASWMEGIKLHGSFSKGIEEPSIYLPDQLAVCKAGDAPEWCRAHCAERHRADRPRNVPHLRCRGREGSRPGHVRPCYTPKRQDEEYFAGLRERFSSVTTIPAGYAEHLAGGKRSIVVHHRLPGVSRLHLMMSLCPARHAIVSRTRVIRRHIESTPIGAVARATAGRARTDDPQAGTAAISVSLFASAGTYNASALNRAPLMRTIKDLLMREG